MTIFEKGDPKRREILEKVDKIVIATKLVALYLAYLIWTKFGHVALKFSQALQIHPHHLWDWTPF